jgi:hypothetical protein
LGVSVCAEAQTTLDERNLMRSTKKRKSAKSKTTTMRVKDLRPMKDAKGGAQKKDVTLTIVPP